MPNPTPTTLTLLLKHGTTTVLLYAPKDQLLTTLKANLLSALRSRCPEKIFNGIPLPSSPDEIHLARPLDSTDLSKGWIPLIPPDDGDLELDDSDGGKGKGKGKGKGRASSGGTGKETLASLGVKEGGVLAFRFEGGEGEGWMVEVPVFEEEEDEFEDEGIDVGDDGAEGAG